MANGPYPQYPVMPGPSLQSVMGRQRMHIEDAMYGAERQRERQSELMEKGAKGAYQYDKLLRGFMEAKYANPELKFWDYVSKPSVGAAFRKQGRDLIAEQTLAGEEIKGMGLGARHKAGLRGLFGKDRNVLAELEEGVGVASGMESKQVGDQGVDVLKRKTEESIREELGVSEYALEKMEKMAKQKAMTSTDKGIKTYKTSPEAEAYFDASGKLEEQYGKISDITERIKKGSETRRVREAYVMPGEKLKDILEQGKVPIPGDPGYKISKRTPPRVVPKSELTTQKVYSEALEGSLAEKQDIYQKALKKRGTFKYEGPEIPGIKEAEKNIETAQALRDAIGNPAVDAPTKEILKTELSRIVGTPKPYAGAGETVAKVLGKGATQAEINTAMAEATKRLAASKGTDVAGESAKVAGKGSGVLGKLGYGAALAGGLAIAADKRASAQQRVGGGVSAAGGAAGLIAATNFWNPVGWAAAIPAALGVAGTGLSLTGGKKDSLAGTPLGRYRRRVGIV